MTTRKLTNFMNYNWFLVIGVSLICLQSAFSADCLPDYAPAKKETITPERMKQLEASSTGHFVHLKFSNCDFEKDSMRILLNDLSPKHLSFVHCFFSPDVASEFPNSDSLESASFYKCTIGNWNLGSLLDCPKLKELSILDCIGVLKVSPWNGKSSSMLHLAIGNTKVENLDFLRSLPSLRSLSVNNDCSLSDKDLDNLRVLPRSLKSLAMQNRSLTDNDLRFLAGLSGLERLDLQHTAITGPGLNFIQAAGLSELLLARSNFSDPALKELAKLKNLKLVDIRDSKVSVESWFDSGLEPKFHLLKTFTGDRLVQAFINRPEIAAMFMSEGSLNLSDTNLTNAGLKKLVGVFSCNPPWRIDGLNISGNRSVTDDGLSRLDSLVSLVMVNMSGCNIKGVGLDKLGTTHIKAIDLSNNPLTVEGIEKVCQLPVLTDLRLADGALPNTPNRLNPLSKAKRLQSLDLSYNQLTPLDIKAVSRIASLRTLYLDGIDLNPSLVSNLNKIEYLHISNCRGLNQQVAHLLGRLARLKRVWIIGTPVSECELDWLKQRFDKHNIVQSEGSY